MFVSFADFIEWFWGQTSYMLAFILATSFVAFKMPKKNRFWIRFLVGIVFVLVIKMGLDLLLIRNKSYDWLRVVNLTISLISYFALAVILLISFKCNIFGSLFCVTMGYGFQHISFLITCFFHVTCKLLNYNSPTWLNAMVLISITTVSYAILFLLLIKPMKHYNMVLDNKIQIIVTLAFILSSIFLDTLILQTIKEYFTALAFLAFSIIATLLGLLLEKHNISTANRELELDFVAKLKTEEAEKLEYDKKVIDVLNIKAHDLKHQIMTDGAIPPEAYEEAKNIVEEYDSLYMTGSAALDAVLTRKTFNAKNNNVKLTCLADGSSLSFIKDVDLYSLFGNLLDNAIEAASKTKDEKRRVVSVSVNKKDYFVSITVTNYYENEIIYQDGEIVSTKEDRFQHGFGLKSVKDTVSKYGGDMIIRNENRKFVISILFPLKERQD
ncbi:MAG: GHKL domain-containing protein [Bacilli bacterium]|nr:GHKL domain-containing protein [Bacilli bacterium]